MNDEVRTGTISFRISQQVSEKYGKLDLEKRKFIATVVRYVVESLINSINDLATQTNVYVYITATPTTPKEQNVEYSKALKRKLKSLAVLYYQYKTGQITFDSFVDELEHRFNKYIELIKQLGEDRLLEDDTI